MLKLVLALIAIAPITLAVTQAADLATVTGPRRVVRSEC